MQRHRYWPLTLHWRRVLTVSLGVTLGVGLVAMLADFTHYILVVTSLGASSLILFGFPDAAFAQPRNFVGGNLITALIGLAFFHVIGSTWWAIAIATGAATAAMMTTDTVHPPAASNPLIICALHAGWNFLLFPILCGDLLILGIALTYHRVTRKNYPHYWI